MKTVLYLRLHRRFTGVEFGALVLSKVEYKRVNASYKISDTSLTFLIGVLYLTNYSCNKRSCPLIQWS